MFHTNGIGFKECQWIYGSKYLLRSYKRPPDITRPWYSLARCGAAKISPWRSSGIDFSAQRYAFPMIFPSYAYFLTKISHEGTSPQPDVPGGWGFHQVRRWSQVQWSDVYGINWIKLACSISGWVFTQWLLPVTSKPNVTLLKCWTMLTQRRRFPIVFFPSKPMG